MNNRPLQPGDLCWILPSPNTYDAPTSHQCVLEEHCPAGSIIRHPTGFKRTNVDGWYVKLQDGASAAVATKFLLRIDGDPDAEQGKINEEKPEEAMS